MDTYRSCILGTPHIRHAFGTSCTIPRDTKAALRPQLPSRHLAREPHIPSFPGQLIFTLITPKVKAAATGVTLTDLSTCFWNKQCPCLWWIQSPPDGLGATLPSNQSHKEQHQMSQP